MNVGAWPASSWRCAVSFRMDGFEAEHDAFRSPGSWQRVVRAIDLTVAGGMRTGVNTTINRSAGLRRSSLIGFRDTLDLTPSWRA